MRLVKLFLFNLVHAKIILREYFLDENLLDEKKVNYGTTLKLRLITEHKTISDKKISPVAQSNSPGPVNRDTHEKVGWLGLGMRLLCHS